jgi:triosephosphate isomerase
MRHPVVMGNWKLNGSKEMVVDLLNGLNAELEGVTGVDVAVAPPALFVDLAERTLTEAGSAIILGAQNSDLNNSGAFTGDMSPAMLKEFGASHIIIGHSERREYHNESDEFVAKKFAFLKENGLTPVLCIGESEAQNEAGETVAVCARQLDAVINTQGVEALEGAIIAYEPIWAIGTGKTCEANEANRICGLIRKWIGYEDVIIQYGGSVKSNNIDEIMSMSDIDGVLVGGASLDPINFARIANYEKI